MRSKAGRGPFEGRAALALAVMVLGALLGAGGAYFVVLGFDIVLTERGAAMTIGGVVALSGGVVTFALGCAVLRLTQILNRLEQQSTIHSADQIGSVDAPPALAPAAASAAAVAAAAGGVAALAGAAAAYAHEEAQDTVAPPPSVAGAGHGAPAGEDATAAASPAASADIEFLLADRMPEAAPKDEVDALIAELAAPVEEARHADEAAEEAADEAPDHHASAASDDDPSNSDIARAADDPEPDAGGRDDEQPVAERTILGSYKAGGRTYTMYSDGSVEALTDDGVERFDSMEALRSHLARS